ncbi:hypothetical protein WJX74_006879 [Apatococcus lobatus]|uniref:Uncharacterized protein n=1 Tax=Apatococcus lobatus TaxID=904363 RepID=A0AAW1RD23_9CHLO
MRIKLASLALAGAAASSTASGDQIKAAWPVHVHHQPPQPMAAAALPPRGPPKPYKTFSGASQDVGRGDNPPTWGVSDVSTAAAATVHKNESRSAPVKQPSLPSAPSLGARQQRGTRGGAVNAAEPSLISWDELEAPEDVYHAVTLADGRPALVKGRSGKHISYGNEAGEHRPGITSSKHMPELPSIHDKPAAAASAISAAASRLPAPATLLGAASPFLGTGSNPTAAAFAAPAARAPAHGSSHINSAAAAAADK